MLSILLIKVFCSSVNLFSWLQNHLIPCPFKTLTGFDCPGCGFQRALILLVKGDFQQSWNVYPPTIPLLSIFLFATVSYIFPFKKRSAAINILAVITGNFVLFSYLYKLVIG